MNARIPSVPLQFSLAVVLTSAASLASAQSFSIHGTNVVMPNSGSTTSQYTVTGIPITGTIIVSCTDVAPIDPSIRAPVCYAGLPHATPVVAGQTSTGTVQFMTFPVPIAGFVFWPTTLLLCAFALRTRRKWLLPAMAVSALAFATSISACGGNSNGLTPGTYQFTVSAVNSASPGQPPSYLAQTTVTVKVP